MRMARSKSKEKVCYNKLILRVCPGRDFAQKALTSNLKYIVSMAEKSRFDLLEQGPRGIGR